jgi:hypothetical protein
LPVFPENFHTDFGIRAPSRAMYRPAPPSDRPAPLSREKAALDAQIHKI